MSPPHLTVVPRQTSREHRAARLALFLERQETAKKAAEAAAVLNALPKPRRGAERGIDGFLPTPRGSVVSYDPSQRSLMSPRPVTYLCGLRCVDDLLCTALDHAILEVVLAAAYEVDGFLVAGSYEIPLSSVLSILGPSMRRREVMESLVRLSTRMFSLPALPVTPGRRVRTRAAPDPEWLEDELHAYVRRIVVSRTGDQDEAEAVVWQIKDATGDDYADVLRDIERRYGLFDRGLVPAAHERRMKRPPRTPPDFRLDEVASSRPSETSDGRVAFTPIRRHVVDGDQVVVELDAHLVETLDLTRVQKGRRTPYVHLDLRAMATFSSRYTPQVYRHVLAGTIETVVRRVVHWRKLVLAKRVRPRVGWWTEHLDLDVAAEVASYRWTAGGRAAQFARTVLPGLRRDLETLRDVLHVDVSGKGALDLAIRHLPRTDTIQGRYPELRRTAAVVEVDRFDGTLFRHPTPREIVGRRLSPYDAQALMVGASAWSSIGHHLWIPTVDEMQAASLAWHAAIGEMHGEALTDGAMTRRSRGERLRALIDEVGANRAALVFFVEEWGDPDLLRPGVLPALLANGTLDRFARERQLRATGMAPAERLTRFTKVWIDDAAQTVERHLIDEDGPIDFVARNSLPSVAAFEEEWAEWRRETQTYYNEGRRKGRRR